jgi:hypothetical protein
MCRITEDEIDFNRDKRVVIWFMLFDGVDRINALTGAMERAGVGPEVLEPLSLAFDMLWELREKHHYVPEGAVPTTAGYEGETLVGVDEGSAAEEAVYRTCKGIYDLMTRLEDKTSSMLAERYRKNGIPSPDTNSWIENQTLQWVEAHEPELLRERLAMERKASAE